jgi:hypothetical protein
MSVVLSSLPRLRPSLELDAGLILRAFDLAADQPYGFTREDLECVEAYWVHRAAGFSSLGCVASLTDGRRFHLAYVGSVEPEEDVLPESVAVTQMMTMEPLPAGRASFWIVDVAELNDCLGLPLIPAAPPPVILPLPARH